MQSTILLPLYIYPSPHAWDPLHTAIQTHPTLSFHLIVNPHNGPGAPPWWPNDDYVREMPRLNALHNVRLLGYVCTGYCARSVERVERDVGVWAERGRRDGGLRVGGVFVDETVNLGREGVKGYLDRVDGCVREGMEGWMVIHNPGTAVAKELANPGPDVTVVVETAYGEFRKKEYQEWLETSPYERSRTCYMIHSVPVDEVRNLTLELRQRAQYLFVTSARERFYESFGPSWEAFVAAMAE